MLAPAVGGAAFVALLACSSLWGARGPFATAVVAACGIAAAAILLRARVPGPSVAVVLAALGLYAVYFGYTALLQRNPDAGSHLAYVRYLIEHRALPASGDCSVCHHPPLFYVAAAAFAGLAERAHLADLRTALQAFAFLVFTAFALFAALAVNALARGTIHRAVATALAVLWPYAVIDSVRVSNDTALYAVAAVTLYLLARWVTDGGRRHLIGACLAAAIGLSVKANAIALVAAIAAIAAYRIARSRERAAIARFAAPVVGALLLATALHGLARGDAADPLPRAVLGTAYKTGPKELAPAGPGHYLGFDPAAFVRTPYVELRRFQSAEPSFWNHLLKSSLFGGRNAGGLRLPGERVPRDGLALAANWLLLGLTVFLAAGLLLSVRAAGPARGPCLLAAGAFVAVALGFHLLVPFGAHADFRFAFPAVIPMAALYADALDGARARSRILWAIGLAIAVAFLAVAVAYFLPVTFVDAPAPAPGAAPRLLLPLGPR